VSEFLVHYRAQENEPSTVETLDADGLIRYTSVQKWTLCQAGTTQEEQLVDEQYRKALMKYNKLAKQHGLNPVFLRNILELTLKGHNRSEVAATLGISRQTVHKYLLVVKEDLDDSDWLQVVIGLLIFMGGVAVLNNLFGGEGGDQS